MSDLPRPALRPEQLADTPAQPTAQLSLRAVTLLEMASVSSSVLITAWVISPLQLRQRWLEVVPGLLALLLIVNSHRLHGEGPRELGFTTRHFWRAAKLLTLPMIVGTGLLIGGGYLAGSFSFAQRASLLLAALPFWGLLQQYVLQAFIYRRLKLILLASQMSAERQAERTRVAIVIAALLFGLIHAPNWPLMMLTLIAGLVWCWVYEHAPNLYAIAISHGLMSAVAMGSLPPWLLQSMRVGYRYFIFQRF